MPELPEVEVTRQKLSPQLVGRRVSKVLTTEDSYFFLTPPKELARRLRGQSTEQLCRHGKYLWAELGDGSRLMLHLGMTGQLFSADTPSLALLSSTASAALSPQAQKGFQPDRHTHVQLHFDDGGPAVFFRDVRKFGKIRWIPPDGEDERLKKLGPDALLARPGDLYKACERRAAAIKGVLLNQSILAGVGNIYADEGLFRAKIHPKTPARTLSKPALRRLLKEVQGVMRRSIETGGSSISDYIAPDGSKGSYQDERSVYARKGEPCPRCETPIEREVVAQRSTHFCPRCQKPPAG